LGDVRIRVIDDVGVYSLSILDGKFSTYFSWISGTFFNWLKDNMPTNEFSTWFRKNWPKSKFITDLLFGLKKVAEDQLKYTKQHVESSTRQEGIQNDICKCINKLGDRITASEILIQKQIEKTNIHLNGIKNLLVPIKSGTESIRDALMETKPDGTVCKAIISLQEHTWLLQRINNFQVATYLSDDIPPDGNDVYIPPGRVLVRLP
jgi:hypothetical protein